MKRTIIKEIIWLACCLIAAFLLFELVPSRNALDINMHDTYLIGGGFGHHLSTMNFVFTYFTIIGFWLYLIRALYFSFKLIPTNIILLVFTGLVLYSLSDVIYIIHPPVIDNTSSAMVTGLFYGRSYSGSYVWGTRFIRIFLILVLAFTGTMIGRNWDKPRVV